jgi:hypothetical protein
VISFGLYKLMLNDTTFSIWHGAWPRGYYEAANGNIRGHELVIEYTNPYHKIPKRVIKELQKQFNPEIKS